MIVPNSKTIPGEIRYSCGPMPRSGFFADAEPQYDMGQASDSLSGTRF